MSVGVDVVILFVAAAVVVWFVVVLGSESRCYIGVKLSACVLL